MSETKLSEWKDCWKKPIKVQYREVQPIKQNLLGDWGEFIKTREGELWGYVDVDYIIKGVKGEEYPIGKTIFEKTYTLTDEVSALTSERDALKEKAKTWDEFRASFRNYKCNYGIICTEKIDAEARLESVAGVIDESPGFDENSPGQFSTAYRDFLKKLNDALGGVGVPTETGEEKK